MKFNTRTFVTIAAISSIMTVVGPGVSSAACFDEGSVRSEPSDTPTLLSITNNAQSEEDAYEIY